MAKISSDIFHHIRRIQIQTTRAVNDVFAGAYHSAFKGRGMEFEEVREYQPGDEERTIDWNVTARMNHPYVKVFREERELTVILVVDISASSRFGSKNRLKSEIIAEIGAVLAFSAIKNEDKVGLILFSSEIEKYIPPKKGLRHVLRVIRELLAFEPQYTGTNLSNALTFLGKVRRRPAVCFVISDFICPDYSHEASLIAKKHDLITISITDPLELAFPQLTLVNLRDLETGISQFIDTSDFNVQTQFEKRASQRLIKHKQLMKKIGAGYIPVYTDQPYTGALRKFFKIRERRKV
jgi:uncharacterized protein (DUF58 family)